MFRRLSILCFVVVLAQNAPAQNVDTTARKHNANSLDEQICVSINHWGPGLEAPFRFISNSIFVRGGAIPVGIYVGGLADKNHQVAADGLDIAAGELIAFLVTSGTK